MKAQKIYFPQAGVAELREVEVADPAPDEIQVQTVANGICMFEVSVFTGTEPKHLGNPQGHEGVGIVTKVGRDVTKFKEGDYAACGNWATVQNYDDGVARLSGPPIDASSFLIEPVACIVIALRSYDITPGDRALVLGGGFMGLLNVQGLMRCPLRDLVVADVKQANLDLARSYGATEVINSGTEEGRARLAELENEPFDLVVECAGVPATIEMASKLTRRGGRLAIFAWHHQPRSIDLGLWHTRGLKVMNCAPPIGADYKFDNMQRAVWLLERGVFDLRRMVTHRHSYRDVQEAMELSSKRPGDYIKGVLSFS